MQGKLLIVEPESEQALAMRDALLADGHSVQVVHTFQSAVQALAGGGVAVMVTAVRLAAFNGLHLIIRSRALYPHVRCIVVGLPADRCSDIDRLGVPFLQKPVDGGTIASIVSQEIDQAAAMPQRRWPRKHVRLPAVVANADLDIIDLSYGGLRLQATTPVRVGTELTVNVPSLGVSITAVARWSKPLHEDGVTWCGAEIIDASSGTANDWRGVVDSLN